MRFKGGFKRFMLRNIVKSHICFYCLIPMVTIGDFVKCPQCGYMHSATDRKVRSDKGQKRK